MFISNFILRSVFKAFGNAKIVATTELYKTITLCFLITTLGHFYQLSGIIFALILSEFLIFIYVVFNLKKLFQCLKFKFK